MAYVPDANNISEPTSARPAGTAAAEFRAIKQKIASLIAGMVVTSAAGANAADLTSYFQPALDDRQAIAAAGWLPWNFNQLWGGAGCMPMYLYDSGTDTEYRFDMLDGYIDSDVTMPNTTNCSIGTTVNNVNRYQGINPGKNSTINAIWLKLAKSGNPTDNITAQLWSVAAGLPNALIVSTNSINGRQLHNDPAGSWYRFSFPVPQALVAGTQYIINVVRSGGIDVTNFYSWAAKSVTKYPNNLHGTGTAVPAWTAANTVSQNFICEMQASDQPVQAGGTFNAKIVGNESNPLNKSVGFVKPVREFLPILSQSGWSIILRGKSWTKDRTFFEVMYGLHHDRINVRSAVGTGFTTVTVYDTSGTVTTLVGTSDVSGNSYKDIMIVGRTLGDGADYLRIYTGIGGVWTKENELTAQTFAFDKLMYRRGHAWILGGFPLFQKADYTKLSEFAGLPSGDGWTFTTTTATAEANAFSVLGGRLNQVKGGYAAGGDGFYTRTALGFANAAGWMVYEKSRVSFSTHTKDANGCCILIQDGTKQFRVNKQEFYNGSGGFATNVYTQIDHKTDEVTQLITGKGSDVMTFENGRLSMDGTGFMTTASANNSVTWGDTDTAANENADVVWDCLGYYNTANLGPQFSGGEVHEFGAWTGDKSLLGEALYNAGVPLSIKQYCGIGKNFAGEVQQLQFTRGITSSPSLAAVFAGTDYGLPWPEVDQFVIGTTIKASYGMTISNTAAGGNYFLRITLDGNIDDETLIFGTSPGGSNWGGPSVKIAERAYFGLHKLMPTGAADSGGNALNNGKRRTLQSEVSAY